MCRDGAQLKLKLKPKLKLIRVGCETEVVPGVNAVVDSTGVRCATWVSRNKVAGNRRDHRNKGVISDLERACC